MHFDQISPRLFRALLAATALAVFPGCGAHFYSPSEHAAQIDHRETVASGREATARNIEGANANLRARQRRLRARLETVRANIAYLRGIPDAPDDSARRRHLQELLDEEVQLQLGLIQVQDDIRAEEQRQQQLRDTTL